MEEDDCFVCCERFDTNKRQRRWLPCLHLCCSSCVEDIVRIAAGGEEEEERKNKPCCRVCEEPFELKDVVAIEIAATLVKENTCQHFSNQSGGQIVDTQKRSYCLDCQGFFCNVCQEQAHLSHKNVQGIINQLETAKTKLNEQLIVFSSALTETNTLLINLESRLKSLHQQIETTLTNKLTISTTTTTTTTSNSRSLSAIFSSLAMLKSSSSGRKNRENASSKAADDLQKAEEQRNTLKATATELVKADCKIITLKQHELNMTRDHLLQALQQIDKILVDSIEMNQLGMLTAILNRVSTLEKVIYQPVSLSTIYFMTSPTNTSTFWLPTEELGTVFRLGPFHDYTLISKPIAIFGSYGFGPGQLCGTSGIGQLPDGKIIAVDYSNRLQIFSFENGFERSIGLSHPVDSVSITPAREIWMACAAHSQLTCISPVDGMVLNKISVPKPTAVTFINGLVVYHSHGFIRCVATNGAAKWMFHYKNAASAVGIAPFGESHVLVWSRNDPKVFLLSMENGYPTRTIDVGSMSPIAVAGIHNLDLIVITEAFSASVASLDGRVIHRWGSQGSGPGQFKLADGCIVLKEGRIAIADWNHRIQIF